MSTVTVPRSSPNARRRKTTSRRDSSTTRNVSKRSRSHRSVSEFGWTDLKEDELLDVRICDLNLSLESPNLVALRDRLYQELKQKNLRLRPHCWLSDDWFSPDDIPGIAIPFYLAHPRLIRLERKQMLEVEGGTQRECMRILRHEAGHAIDTAFQLHRRKGYRKMFGNYNAPYPETYRPKPRSKNFVLHLEPWYAQSHPAEDFAETFAVWLTPRSRWRSEYQGWKALKKIEWVDQLMGQLANQKPKVRSRAKVDPVHRLRQTLREYYADKHARYRIDAPSRFDDDLKKLFPQTPKTGQNKTAASFLRKNRGEFSRSVAQWTGEYRYNINQLLREMIERCRFMNLRVDGEESELKKNTLMMLTVHTMNYLHRDHHRVAL